MNTYKAADIINELYEYKITKTSEMSLEEQEEIDKEILEEYIKTDDNGIGMEMPDILSNINGNHIYKLISAKDIDFNNVLLSNSTISNDSMWGGFDEKRRWPNNTNIHINDSYELMNVIDYLLCTTKDLWSELNKMKYNSAISNNIWFLNDLVNEPIDSSWALNPSQFSKGSEYCVWLDPTKYYGTLPAKMNNFGIGTYFIKEKNESIMRSVIQKNYNRNGINGYIVNEVENEQYAQLQVENIDGINTNVYAYDIDDLKFYPMFNIDNYLYSRKDDADNVFDQLVDKINLKLNYDIYFRIVKSTITGAIESKFHKVYVDFLYPNYEELGYPYILYYIDDNDPTHKRNIIYINGSDEILANTSERLTQYSEYINYFYNDQLSLADLGDEYSVFYVKENKKLPYLYHISDYGQITLSVITPSVSNYNSADGKLIINYFKQLNQLKYSITTSELNESNPVNLKLINDTEALYSLLYCPKRYYIPDNTNVYIKFEAPYLSNNPRIIKDDEYLDILLPNIGTDDGKYLYVESDAEAKKYYYYSRLDDEGRRQFNQFNSMNELHNMANSSTNNMVTIQDSLDQKLYLHVYTKNSNPYEITYNFTTNQLLKQPIEDMQLLNSEVQAIQNHTELHLYDSNDDQQINYLKINHILNSEYEQIKFDIDLNIPETSKVSSSNTKIPISINKIHHPAIQFVSSDIMNAEINEYTKSAYTFGDVPNNLAAVYKLEFVNQHTTPLIRTTEGNRKTNFASLEEDPNDTNDQFPKYSQVYRELISSKYNNFMLTDYTLNNQFGTQKRKDLLYYINYSEGRVYNSLQDSFNDTATFDNTLNSSNIVSISYDPEVKYMNLFGDIDLLKQHVNVGINNPNYVTSAFIESVQNTSAHFSQYKKQNALEYTYIPFDTLFNINGLGLNYRLHGGDSYLYINRSSGPNISNHSTNTNNNNISFEKQYDLMSNVCTNNLNNIARYIYFELNDGNNQFNTVSHIGTELEGNNFGFKNKVVDINFRTAALTVQKDGDKLPLDSTNGQRVSTTTYYSTYSFMTINDTTFYPSNDIFPDNHEYDFNDSTDIDKYKKYIEFWDSDSDYTGDENNRIAKYKPITLSLQLKQNLNDGIPFFEESNTAKLKFNIKRVNYNSIYQILFNAIPDIKVVLGCRYYINDLMQISNNTKFCNGSYPIYNAGTDKYDIFEYFGTNRNDNYYILGNIPIQKENGEYQYNIELCSILNKLKFDKNITFVYNEQTYQVNTANNDNYDFSTLFYIDFNEDLINDLHNNCGGYTPDKVMRIQTIVHGLYGTKQYNNQTTTEGTNNILSTNPQITFKFVTRELPNTENSKIVIDLAQNNIITTVNIVNGEDQGFERNGSYYKHISSKIISGVEVFELPDSYDNLYYCDIETGSYMMKTISSLVASIIAGIGSTKLPQEAEYRKIGLPYLQLINLFENYNIFEKIGDAPINNQGD